MEKEFSANQSRMKITGSNDLFRNLKDEAGVIRRGKKRTPKDLAKKKRLSQSAGMAHRGGMAKCNIPRGEKRARTGGEGGGTK